MNQYECPVCGGPGALQIKAMNKSHIVTISRFDEFIALVEKEILPSLEIAYPSSKMGETIIRHMKCNKAQNEVAGIGLDE